MKNNIRNEGFFCMWHLNLNKKIIPNEEKTWNNRDVVALTNVDTKHVKNEAFCFNDNRNYKEPVANHQKDMWDF